MTRSHEGTKKHEEEMQLERLIFNLPAIVMLLVSLFLSRLWLHLLGGAASAMLLVYAAIIGDAEQDARRAIAEFVRHRRCGPALLRLAFHDAATFDAETRTGGANASIR